jgi:beta-glucosidase
MAGRTYRYFGGEALYPFGYGLSYTTFKYGKPALSAAKLKAGQPLKVSVEVTNAGGRDGDEVVQLYVTRPGVPARRSGR